MKLNKKFKVLAIGAALVLSIGAVGCSKQEEAPKEEAKQEQAKAEVKTIKGDEVVEAMKDANTVVIDARDASEYEAGHIKGALNVFVDEVGKFLLETGAKFYTGHCTGIPAYERLKEIMGDKIDYLASGSVETL